MRPASVVLALLWLVPVLAAQRPAVFRDLDFASAQAEAQADGRLLVLDAMTSWCGPCRQMDATSWVDVDVVGYLNEHAVAIQLDMDEHEALKQQLTITAFPTIILFRDGVEFDRVVGFRTGTFLLSWFRDAREDKTALDRVREEIARLHAAEPTGDAVHRLAHLAAELVDHGAHDQAADEYVWLWLQGPALAPEVRGARWSEWTWRMKELAAASHDARARFVDLRDAVGAKVAGGTAKSPDLRDWIELNAVLGDDARTVAWARERANEPGGEIWLREFGPRLFDLLADHDAWREAGLAVRHPVESVEAMGRDLGAYDLPTPDAAPRAPMPPEDPTATPAASRPMIPLGGLTPAAPRAATPAPADAPATLPAIPLGGMKPAAKRPAAAGAFPAVPPGAFPAVPPGAFRAVPPGAFPAVPPGALPAIPLGGGRAQRPDDPAAIAEEIRGRLTHQLRVRASRLYGALLAAGRDEEADQVAAALLRHADDRQARLALVGAAIRAAQTERRRDVLLRWLDEAR